MFSSAAFLLGLLADPSLTATEERMALWLDEHHAAAAALLQRLTDVNSGTQNPEGVRRVGELLEAELEALAFRTWWEPAVPGSGRGPHLFAEREGGRGRRVLLIGHLDTVFEAGSTFQRYEPRGDFARGPGVVDMKGGNVVIVQALQALAAAGALEGATIRVAFTGDEEDPGPLPESRRAFRELAARCDVALGFEASAEGLGSATVGRRGATSWMLRTQGEPGHSSAVFSARYGSGAVFEAARILNAFHEALRGEPNLTFSAGLALGGGAVEVDEDAVRGTASGKLNVIPGQAVVLGDLRFLSAEQEKSAHERMRRIAAEGNLPRTSATIEFRPGYPAMEPKPGNYALLEALDGVSRALGQGKVTATDPARRGAGDISFVADLVDALDGLGASGDGAHTTGETIDLRTLPAITKRAAVLIHRLTR